MKEKTLSTLTEDELDTLVSIAIRRAEILDDARSPLASAAWQEVMLYEERLAAMTSPEALPGGVARVGAVWSALAAGERIEATRLATQYRAEKLLPPERRVAMDRAFQTDQERLGRRFPAITRRGILADLANWRTTVTSGNLRVFPYAV